MTTVYYPDRSQFQGRTPVTAHAVSARATEGDWLTDTCWGWNSTRAHNSGTPLLAYHFLEDGSTSRLQAAHCYAVVGKTPLMLDFEPITGTAHAVAADDPGHFCGQAWAELQAWLTKTAGASVTVTPELAASAPYISKPGLAMAAAFIDHYRSLGGICHVVYLPHWYWQVLGSPSLQPFTDRNMVLVSSDYTTYSDTGPGWAGYGGMTPVFWQYTSTGPGNQDWNAYRGHGTTVTAVVDEIRSVWLTGTAKPVTRIRVRHAPCDGTVTLNGLIQAQPHNTPATVIRLTLEHTKVFVDGMGHYVSVGDWNAPLPKAEVWYYTAVTG